jgi:hypothetical protein
MNEPSVIADVHSRDWFPGRYTIYLNGNVIHDCYRAEQNEDGTGRVFIYKRNAEGKFYPDPAHGARGIPASEMFIGRVVIIDHKTVVPVESA